MEALYIKLNIAKSDIEIDEIRENGMLFTSISAALYLDRNSVEEIDENNYLSEIKNIQNKYSKMNNNIFRIGVCKHTHKKVLQYKDKYSNDAIDKIGWLCLHRETRKEELCEIREFQKD